MTRVSNKPTVSFRDRVWLLPGGVKVKTHKYDNSLYAFEVTQRNDCLGMIIPKTYEDMIRMEYILENNISINGFECNDGFGTVIKLKE